MVSPSCNPPASSFPHALHVHVQRSELLYLLFGGHGEALQAAGHVAQALLEGGDQVSLRSTQQIFISPLYWLRTHEIECLSKARAEGYLHSLSSRFSHDVPPRASVARTVSPSSASHPGTPRCPVVAWCHRKNLHFVQTRASKLPSFPPTFVLLHSPQSAPVRTRACIHTHTHTSTSPCTWTAL